MTVHVVNHSSVAAVINVTACGSLGNLAHSYNHSSAILKTKKFSTYISRTKQNTQIRR